MVVRVFAVAMFVTAAVVLAGPVWARQSVELTFDEALALASRVAPEIAVAQSREAVARTEVGVAGVYPNPVVFAGTTTQTARLSAGISVPLVVLGQRGAAVEASRAELQTVRVDSTVTLNEVRTACARAFVALWLAQRTAEAREEAARVARRIEGAVQARIEVGTAPEIEGLRVRAERLRAEADAREATELVAAAGSELGRWVGLPSGEMLLAKGDPPAPDATLPLASLLQYALENPAARREDFDARAAEARAHRERALVRPALTLDLGFDAYDPGLPATNYRAQLGIDLPLFNQRGPYIDREAANASSARARASAIRVRISTEMTAAWRLFTATAARKKALAEGVVPAAEKAAAATEESYTLGRAPLVAVLDAERARIDARMALIDARAANANAWIDIRHAMGWA